MQFWKSPKGSSLTLFVPVQESPVIDGDEVRDAEHRQQRPIILPHFANFLKYINPHCSKHNEATLVRSPPNLGTASTVPRSLEITHLGNREGHKVLCLHPGLTGWRVQSGGGNVAAGDSIPTNMIM